MKDRRKSAAALTRGAMPKDEPIKKHSALLPASLTLRELFGKRLGRERFALRGQDAEPAALRELLENAVGLLFQPCRDLGGRGRLRQARLGQLEQPEAAEAPEPLGVFLHRLRVIFFLELAGRQAASLRSSVFVGQTVMLLLAHPDVHHEAVRQQLDQTAPDGAPQRRGWRRPFWFYKDPSAP